MVMLEQQGCGPAASLLGARGVLMLGVAVHCVVIALEWLLNTFRRKACWMAVGRITTTFVEF